MEAKVRRVMLVVAVLFAAAAVWVLTGAAATVEQWVYERLAQAMTPALTAGARVLTRLCDPLVVAAVCLVLLVIPATRRPVGLPVAATAAAAAAINTGLKHIFRRPRPRILWLIEESGFSFPSGHSATSAALGAVLCMLALRHVKNPTRRAVAVTGCVLYPLVVGCTRVYLGVHYAGDVLAGWLLGTVVGLGIYLCCGQGNSKRS